MKKAIVLGFIVLFLGTAGAAMAAEPLPTPEIRSVYVVAHDRVDVSWNTFLEDTGGTYFSRVYRNGEEVYFTDSQTFIDRGLEPETTYTYTVILEDRYGNKSASSEEEVAVTPAVRNLVRQGKVAHLRSQFALERHKGMLELDHSLVRLVHEGLVDVDEARTRARVPEEFTGLLHRQS